MEVQRETLPAPPKAPPLRVLLTGGKTALGKAVAAALKGLRLLPALPKAGVDAAVHLDWDYATRPSEEGVERNVLGAMERLAAAAEAGARSVVLVTSTAVYGPRPANPSFMAETRRVRTRQRTAWARHMAEAEGLAREYLSKYDGLSLTILRPAHVVGRGVDSPLMRYLSTRYPPVALGFDPHLQLLHVDDLAAAVRLAIEVRLAGPVNLAPDGIVPLLLLLRRLGKSFQPIPHAALGALRPDLPFDSSFLRFRCCGHTRRMTQELGFRPARDLESILAELAPRRRKARP